MIKRSELKENMFIRMSDILDTDSYWSRLMKGRYFEINRPAPEPDEAVYWSTTMGSIINYGMNYIKQASNSNMETISEKEKECLKYIFANNNEFKDLFIKLETFLTKLTKLEDLHVRQTA